MSEKKEPQSFAFLLAEADGGTVNDELSKRYNRLREELTDRAHLHDETFTGEITVKLKVSVEGKSGKIQWKVDAPVTLLDLAEGLEITIKDKVADVTKREGGGCKIAFESETSTSMDVPAAFVIAIPVFEGGDLYQLPVRLKMTARREGDTKRAEWKLELYGVARVLKAAIEASVDAVKVGTGLPVFMGSPEQ